MASGRTTQKQSKPERNLLCWRVATGLARKGAEGVPGRIGRLAAHRVRYNGRRVSLCAPAGVGLERRRFERAQSVGARGGVPGLEDG